MALNHSPGAPLNQNDEFSENDKCDGQGDFSGEHEESAVEDKVSAMEDEECTEEDEMSVVKDEQSTEEDKVPAAVEDEVSAVEDEVSAVEDEVSAVEDEVSAVEDEVSAIEDEVSAVEDGESTEEDGEFTEEDEESTYDESGNPQKLSIQLLDQKKIKKIIGSEKEGSSLDQTIEEIVSNYYTSPSEPGKKKKKKYTHHNKYKKQEKHLEDAGSYEQITYTLFTSYTSKLGKQSDDRPKKNVNSHRILFFFKNEPQKIIFALTCGQAFKVIKQFVDYSFPLKVIEKIGNPQKIIKSERRHLFGRRIKEIIYNETKYEDERDSSLDLYYLLETFTCEIKYNSSLNGLLNQNKETNEEPDESTLPADELQLLSTPKKKKRRRRRNERSKITVRATGIVRIEKRIGLSDYPKILDLLVMYRLDMKTYDYKNQEEEVDPSFSFLHFLCLANRPNSDLNKHLMQDIFRQYKNNKEGAKVGFYIRHKYLEDFLFSNKFQIQISKGQNYKKIGERPPTMEQILAIINESDEDKFVKKFSECQLRFAGRQNECFTDCLINYVEGELLLDDGSSYFRLRNTWYELTFDYTARLHRDFKNLIKISLIDRERDFDAFLPRCWKKREDDAKKDEDEDSYNEAYLEPPFDKYSPQEGYLVFDRVLDRKRNSESIECCDILKYTNDTIYLYHVKKKFGQDTRAAASQILNAAKLIRSSLSLKQPENFLERIHKSATTMPKNEETKLNQYLRKVKDTIEKQNFGSCTKFINLFSRRKVVFVYAYCVSKKGTPFAKELENYYVTPDNLTSIDKTIDGRLLFQTLVNLGYLDQFGDPTGKFCYLEEANFELGEKFNYKKEEIFEFLKKYQPRARSTIGKLELVQVANDLRKIGFDFKICEIDRATSSAAEISTPIKRRTLSPTSPKKTKTQSSSGSKKRKIPVK